MLKIRGNKEFVQWWDHWMSRIHPNGSGAQTTPTAMPKHESPHENKERANKQNEIKTPCNPHRTTRSRFIR
jgi:hypothetical protein